MSSILTTGLPFLGISSSLAQALDPSANPLELSASLFASETELKAFAAHSSFHADLAESTIPVMEQIQQMIETGRLAEARQLQQTLAEICNTKGALVAQATPHGITPLFAQVAHPIVQQWMGGGGVKHQRTPVYLAADPASGDLVHHSGTYGIPQDPETTLPAIPNPLYPADEAPKTEKIGPSDGGVLDFPSFPRARYTIGDGVKLDPELEGLPDGALVPLTPTYKTLLPGTTNRVTAGIFDKELGTVFYVPTFSLTAAPRATPAKQAADAARRAMQSHTSKDQVVREASHAATVAEARKELERAIEVLERDKKQNPDLYDKITINAETLNIEGTSKRATAADLLNDPNPFNQSEENVDVILIGLHGATHPTRSNAQNLIAPFTNVLNMASQMGVSVLPILPDLAWHGRGPKDPNFDNLNFTMDWLQALVDKLKNRYPKALLQVYGRSWGGNLALEMAKRGITGVDFYYADSAYPPGTLEEQSRAIEEREAAARKLDPTLPILTKAPHSEEMLEKQDPSFTFTRIETPFPKPRDIVARFGTADDNYIGVPEYPHRWQTWGERVGIQTMIDNGDHNVFAGYGIRVPENGDPAATEVVRGLELVDIAKNFAGLIAKTMLNRVEEKSFWHVRNIRRREADFKQRESIYTSTLEGLKKPAADQQVHERDKTAKLAQKIALEEALPAKEAAIQATRNAFFNHLSGLLTVDATTYQEIFNIAKQQEELRTATNSAYAQQMEAANATNGELTAQITHLRQQIKETGLQINSKTERDATLHSLWREYEQAVREFSETKSQIRKVADSIEALHKRLEQAARTAEAKQPVLEKNRVAMEVAKRALHAAHEDAACFHLIKGLRSSSTTFSEEVRRDLIYQIHTLHDMHRRLTEEQYAARDAAEQGTSTAESLGQFAARTAQLAHQIEATGRKLDQSLAGDIKVFAAWKYYQSATQKLPTEPN